VTHYILTLSQGEGHLHHKELATCRGFGPYIVADDAIIYSLALA